MRIAIRVVVAIAIAVLSVPALGQAKPDHRVKVLTVCEVLGNVHRYSNAAVAVVGRMERSVSVIDHYEFLSQDHCEHPVITNGHTWENKMMIWASSEMGMPDPPSDKPDLDHSIVVAKLSTLRKTTKLGTHKEPAFKAEDHQIRYTGQADVSNERAVVYGRIVLVPDLNKNCGVKGCGGFGEPVILMATPYNVHNLRDDGSFLPADDDDDSTAVRPESEPERSR